jgi:putative SOS response-associated peptidase YedK
MCGRYTIAKEEEMLAVRFHVEVPPGTLLHPSYNAAPSQQLPAILNTEPDRLSLLSWGFVPGWADGKPSVRAVINARSESIATKPFFRSAFKNKRCLVVADGFYEWHKVGTKKTPYRITLKTDEPFAFAGLWSEVHDKDGTPRQTFAIITTEANDLMSKIHDRMPVILHEEDEEPWLDPGLSLNDAESLLCPFPAQMMHMYEVSTRVNSPRYNKADLIEPVDS